MADNTDNSAIIACHDCGLIHEETTLDEKRTVLCARCNSPVYRERPGGLDRALSILLGAVPLFLVAHIFPLMTLELSGREIETTLLAGPYILYQNGMWPLAILVGMAASLIPGMKLFSTLYVVVSARMNRQSPGYKTFLTLNSVLMPWAMMEVFLLGIIVAYVKLKDLGTLGIGPGCWAFVAVIILLVMADNALDMRSLWRVVGPQASKRLLSYFHDEELASNTTILDCHTCRQIVLADNRDLHPHCNRCGSSLHARKPNSIGRTWALLLAATIMYVPANLLPIMTVVSLGQGNSDTILSGVKTLIQVGMWPVALLVFFASITVPVLKLAGLIYLLFSVQNKSQRIPKDRTLMYRIIEGVGRWSMVDIFMIAILVSLINFGNLASIYPGSGAICFAAVVIITMIASENFEPRLIWDGMESERGRKYQV